MARGAQRRHPLAGASLSPHVLREYALVADGERGALIGPQGEYSWLCAPRWESDAVFSTLVGGTGSYAVTPREQFVWGGYYEPRSLIWRSRWVTQSAIAECREALAFPGDPHRIVILRQIHVLSGDVELDVRLAPAAQFGRRHLRDLHRDEAGRWTARTGPLRLRWSGAAEASVVGDGEADRHIAMTMTLHEGDTHDLVLEISDGELPTEPVGAAAAWTETEMAWEDAMPRLGPMAAERDSELSYAVMRGMTSAGGGMVAASTMSLPERADEGANYDYRYVWIRDQCYAGIAVAADGPHPLLDHALAFVSERLLADGPKLMPAYTTAGQPVPREQKLDLPGYPGGHDILGNHVRDQFQFDTFGETLTLFAAAARHERLTSEHRAAAKVAIDAIGENLQRADSGIWELNENRWAHSRLACAAGLRAAAAYGLGDRGRSQLSAMADTIVADVSSDCLHPGGRWQRAPNDSRVDAALLLPAIRGALPADDPRSKATYRAVQRDLCRDYYVYRFRPEQGLGSTDSAFLLCGFLMAMAALQQNEIIEAARFFERNRAACGPPGLYSEEYDIRQRQMRGNLPQAFVHAAMFEASSALARAPGITEMKGAGR
jgi:GH15 family glucan-1,4-alpha-glucosidase